MSSLEMDEKKCIGCKTCQIACSYHHKKMFNPKIASLKIIMEEQGLVLSIRRSHDLPFSKRGRRLPCDHCHEEPIALCVKYCPVGALKLEKEELHLHG